ncbi:MAG: hypothetical protein KDA52_00355 [Planctomycetaceae bacterium]|nr:hypothetical protein [Planctomycetaceae bacterium]
MIQGRPPQGFPSLRDTGWDNPCYPVKPLHNHVMQRSCGPPGFGPRGSAATTR